MRAILMYHSLDRSGSCISVSPARFRRQMWWLHSAGVRVVLPDELLALPDGVPGATITFDDGIANLMTEAVPVLESYGWPAIVFAVTRLVGTTNRFRGGSRPDVPRLDLLSWGQLAWLRARGWMIGAHSRHHPRLTRLGDEELSDELEGAADDIQARLGARPRWLAYPYGDVNARVAGAAARTYDAACTTELYPLGDSPDAMLLPRLDAVYLNGPTRLAGWGPALQQALGVRRLLRRAGRALRR